MPIWPTPQISQLWPNLTISVKFDNFSQIWQFQPNRDRPGQIRTVQVTPGIPEIPGNLKYLDLGQFRNFCDVSYYSLQFAALALTLCIYIKYDVINDLCIICTALHIIFVKCIFSTSLQWVNLWSASGLLVTALQLFLTGFTSLQCICFSLLQCHWFFLLHTAALQRHCWVDCLRQETGRRSLLQLTQRYDEWKWAWWWKGGDDDGGEK